MNQLDRKYISVPLDQILPPLDDHRANHDPSGIEELARNIAEVGLINPILVKPCGEKYEIIAGHRRYLAHKWIGRANIAAFSTEGEPASADLLKLTENLHRTNLTAVEEAAAVRDLQHKTGKSIQEMGEFLNKSSSWIRSRLHLLDWPQDLINAVHRGQLSTAVAGHLAAIGDDIERNRLTNIAIDSGASARVVSSWRAAWESSQHEVDTENQAHAAAQPYTPPPELMMPCWWSGQPTKMVHMQIVRLAPESVSFLLKLRAEIEKDTPPQRDE